MRRPLFLLLLVIVFNVALTVPLLAQDEPDAAPNPDEPDAAADENPYKLSSGEREAIQKFLDLERFAIKALEARDLDGASRRYKKLLRLLEKDETVPDQAKEPLYQNAHYNLACSLSLSGDTDEAIEQFGKALEHGFRGWKHIVKDTDLDAIRAEDAFKQAVADGKERERAGFEKEEARLGKQLEKGKPLLAGYDFTVDTMKNGSVSLKSYKGQVLVIVFFAPFAIEGPDSTELPVVVQLEKKYRKRGVAVLGMTPRIAGSENRTDWLQPYLDANGIKFDVAAVKPAARALAPYYGSWNETRILVVDAKGTVRAKCGRIQSYEALAAAVDKVLELTPPTPPAGGAKPDRETDPAPPPAPPPAPRPEKP